MGAAGLNLADLAEVCAAPEMNHAGLFPAVAVERESTVDNDARVVHDPFPPDIDIVTDGVERKIVTCHGLRIAGFFARSRVKLSRPLWSAQQAPGSSIGNGLASAFVSPFSFQDAILRSGERRVTAPPSPSMVSLKPRSL